MSKITCTFFLADLPGAGWLTCMVFSNEYLYLNHAGGEPGKARTEVGIILAE
jgi:hypothetical protein